METPRSSHSYTADARTVPVPVVDVRLVKQKKSGAEAALLPPTVPCCCGTTVFWTTPAKVDPGVDFWTEEEIAEEQRLYGKDEANETLEKLFQVIRRGFTVRELQYIGL